MRILFAIPDLLGLGGIQYCGRMAVQALRETTGPNDEVHVLSRMDTTKALTQQIGAPCCGVGGSRVKMAGRLLWLVDRQHWDALLLMHVNLAPALALCPRLPPVLAMLYGIDAWRTLSWPSRLGIQRTAALVSISQHTWRTAKAYNPWMANLPHDLCYLGVAPAGDESTAVDASPEDSPYALTVGRMAGEERYKGFKELIEAWPRLQNSRPGLKLILIGDGNGRSYLEAQARPHGTAVRFLGRVDDATRDRYIRHCTCFCLPSRAEGFGLVYLEAMRVGKPVLAGSGDAGGEVVLDGVTGRAVDPADPEQMLAGLLDVTGPKAAAYGAAGRQRFLNQFTYAHFRDRFVDQVRRVVQERKLAVFSLGDRDG